MKIYLKKTPSTSPLGITTKKSDTLIYKHEGGEEVVSATPVGSLKGKDIADEHQLPVGSDRRFIVWKKEFIDNPWHEGNIPLKDIPDNWMSYQDFVRKSKTISPQTHAELKYNQPRGFLTEERSHNNYIQARAKEKTYLETIKRKFHETNIFDDEGGMSPLDDHIWINAIHRNIEEYGTRGSIFAKDLENSYTNKMAEYYIHDSSKEILSTARVARPKIDANAGVQIVLDKYSKEDQLIVCNLVSYLYEKRIPYDVNTNSETLEGFLYNFVTGEANDQKKRYNDFLQIFNKYQTSAGKSALKHEHFIYMLISKKILIKPRNSDQFEYELDGKYIPLGNMSFLLTMNPKENKVVLEHLEEKLKAKQ